MWRGRAGETANVYSWYFGKKNVYCGYWKIYLFGKTDEWVGRWALRERLSSMRAYVRAYMRVCVEEHVWVLPCLSVVEVIAAAAILGEKSRWELLDISLWGKFLLLMLLVGVLGCCFFGVCFEWMRNEKIEEIRGTRPHIAILKISAANLGEVRDGIVRIRKIPNVAQTEMITILNFEERLTQIDTDYNLTINAKSSCCNFGV